MLYRSRAEPGGASSFFGGAAGRARRPSRLSRHSRASMAGISFGPGVSELSSLKSIDDADILGNTKVRAAAGGVVRLSHDARP